MEYFEIQGGKKLKGEIAVRGSKNAALPILAATILTKKKCVISNLPLIEDIFVMLEILESMGAQVEWLGKRKIAVTCKNINPRKMNSKIVKKIRSSILLLGSLSARFDSFRMYQPGGCKIGARPVGTHFDALEKMGVEIKGFGKIFSVNSKKRKASPIVLREFSVTATENAMMLAASLPGKTTVKIAAAEPHVQDLGKFLVAMGAKIKGLGTHTLEIKGRKNLFGGSHRIIPDANEAATFLILGVASMSRIRVRGAKEEHLDLVLEKLRQFGADFKIGKDCIETIPKKKLEAFGKLDARIYPGFPSDVQAPMGVLATQAFGSTLIHDTLFEGRFNYIKELEKMGARASILNPHQASIKGKTRLKGTTITSFDLRAGASMIIAALIAQGKSIIKDIYQVDRGYEKIEKRLQKLGADIKRLS